jgi:hypothetical protein
MIRLAPIALIAPKVTTLDTAFRDFRRGNTTFQKNKQDDLLTEDDRWIGRVVKVGSRYVIHSMPPPFYLDDKEAVSEGELEHYRSEVRRAPQPIRQSIHFIVSNHEMEEYEENYGKWISDFEQAQEEANTEGYYDEIWEENWRAVAVSLRK